MTAWSTHPCNFKHFSNSFLLSFENISDSLSISSSAVHAVDVVGSALDVDSKVKGSSLSPSLLEFRNFLSALHHSNSTSRYQLTG